MVKYSMRRKSDNRCVDRIQHIKSVLYTLVCFPFRFRIVHFSDEKTETEKREMTGPRVLS